MAPPTVDTVLVPVDGSDEAEAAVEYAVGVAERYGARVHVLVVLGEAESRAVEAGDIDAEAAAAEAQSVATAAAAIAEGVGVPCSQSTAVGFSTTRKLVHPGSVILDAAEEVGADFLVVPRETGTTESDVLEKAAEYVLAYASQPVLSI